MFQRQQPSVTFERPRHIVKCLNIWRFLFVLQLSEVLIRNSNKVKYWHNCTTQPFYFEMEDVKRWKQSHWTQTLLSTLG